MSTLTWSGAPDVTSTSTYWKGYKSVSDGFRTLGWVRTADTGQLSWPSTLISITNAVAAAGTVTFTYTVLQGSALRIGMSIKVTNCTTSGLNATYIIASLPLSNTFTAATATTVTEAETAFGGGDIQVSISNAIGNGSTNTYTFTTLDGVILPGMSVVITGCTTVGFNGTFTIGSINVGGGTFTTTTGISHATEAETGTGIVTTNSVNTTRTSTTIPPLTTNTIYEIWGMSDALQSTLPVYCRLDYGGVSGPFFTITSGVATDGAGNITVVTTGALSLQVNGQTNSSTTSVNNYMSGSTNRMNLLLFPNNTSVSKGGFFNIERSHDTSGNDTSTYVTVETFAGANTPSNSVTRQISFNNTSQTTAETKLTANILTGTGTASFATSVGLSPIFPMVGAVGNPLLGMLTGKSVDWADQTQFSLNMYGTAHNYIVSNVGLYNQAGISTYNSTQTVCIMMRYE